MAQAIGAPPQLLTRVSRTAHEASEPRARDVSLDSSRYQAQFGVPAGRTVQDALPVLLSRRIFRHLS